ncbi:hypothetical protein LTR50_004228 [Elasticomyces elasticus]|nr:hypothetical protein LTR50_004228 [Elasticomyces elasticus]
MPYNPSLPASWFSIWIPFRTFLAAYDVLATRPGAYIPTGFKIRSQVEATSPWAIPAKSLTKKEGTTLSPNICPDCLVEQAIKRRETMIISEEASARDEKGDLRLGDRLSHDDFGSTTTEPGTPTDDHHPSTLIGLGMELQEVHIPGAAVTGFPPDEVGTIIAADLGDMLDAIIIEHRGTLDSVITNLRDGAPGLEDIQRLSKELAEISRAVAEVPIERFTEASMGQSSHPVAAGMKRRRSVIVDAPPAQIRKRVKSIPDLLQLIDSAADNLGLDVGQTNGSAVGTVRNGRVHLAGRRKSTSDEHSLLHGQKSDDQDPLLSTIPISNQRPTAPRSPSRLPNYVLAQDVGTESRFPHHSGEDGLLHKPGEIHVRHSTPSPPTPVSMYRTAWPSPLLLAKTDTTRLSPLLSECDAPVLPSEVFRSRDMSPVMSPIARSIVASPAPATPTVVAATTLVKEHQAPSRIPIASRASMSGMRTFNPTSTSWTQPAVPAVIERGPVKPSQVAQQERAGRAAEKMKKAEIKGSATKQEREGRWMRRVRAGFGVRV